MKELYRPHRGIQLASPLAASKPKYRRVWLLAALLFAFSGSTAIVGALDSAGPMTRVTTDSSGAEANYHSADASLSADGRYVAFSSDAWNLVAGDTNLVRDIFIKDMQTGITTRISTDSSGVEGDGGSNGVTISADGRYAVFSSSATNLVAGDTNATSDVFLKDLQTGTTTRVSTDSAGLQSNGFSVTYYNTAISSDGRYAVFSSSATNLVAGDTNGVADIFVKDLQTGATTRVSTHSSGAQSNGTSDDGTISADGRYVAYWSDATNLVAGDTNGIVDVFVKDRQTGTTTRVSTDSSGTESSWIALPSIPSRSPTISADGRYVAFESFTTNLVAGDTNANPDVFLKDLQTGVTTRISTSAAGVQGNGESYAPSISADGHYLTFHSRASNLVTGDTNGAYDVFVKDLQTGILTRITTDSTGAQSNDWSDNSYISADGRFVAFHSNATNLVAGDTNGREDIFVKEWLPPVVPSVPTSGPGSPSIPGVPDTGIMRVVAPAPVYLVTIGLLAVIIVRFARQRS